MTAESLRMAWFKTLNLYTIFPFSELTISFTDNMHLWLLFLAGTTVYGVSRISEPDLQAVNFAEAIRGQKLTGNVIREMQVDSEVLCSFECVEEEKCISYNFKTSKNKTKGFKCQISTSDRFVSIANFTQDDDFKYVGIKVGYN